MTQLELFFWIPLSLILSVLFVVAVFKVSMFFARKSVKKYNEIAAKKSPVTAEEIIQKFKSLQSKDNPLDIVIEGDEITLKWKLADAEWYEFFKKAYFNSDYKLRINLSQSGKARVIEIRKGISQKYGLGLDVQFSYFRGWQFFATEYQKVYALSELFPPKVSKVVDYNYSANSFRDPALKLLAENGWQIYPCSISTKWGI